jgi:hypothetical protein
MFFLIDPIHYISEYLLTFCTRLFKPRLIFNNSEYSKFGLIYDNSTKPMQISRPILKLVIYILYEGESIIIPTVCFIFRKSRTETLQLHNFST